MARWALLAGVLVTEIVAFTLTFHPWISPSRIAFLEAAVSAFAVAVMLAGWARRPAQIRSGLAATRPSPWHWWLLAHGLATGLLWAITAHGPGHETRAPSWVAAWIACLLVAFALWLAAVVPPRAWGPGDRRTWMAMVAGATAGGAWLLLRLHAHVWIHAWHQERLLTVVAAALRLLGHEVVLDTRQAIIGTPEFNAVAGSRCMGYEGVLLVSLFAGIFVWVCRRRLRFPRALLLVPAAAVVSYALNVVRIVALIEIGIRWPAVALGGFHSVAGWYSVSAVSLGVVVVSHRLGLRVASVAPRTAPVSTAGFYLAPMLAILVTSMLTQAVSTGFDALYPLRVVACAVPLWRHRDRLRGLGWRGSGWAIPIGVAVFAMWMLLERRGMTSVTAAGLAGLPAGASMAWIAFRTVGSVVTVPIAEELAFRGYLVRKLCAGDFERVPLGRFTWLSFLGSSVLFGALHGRWLAGTLAGMAFALTLRRRGRLADPIVAHATANALIALAVLARGAWGLWE